MNATLAQRALPTSNATVRNILLAVAGSLLVAAAAQINVPFWPVPMTMQTLAVLLVGGAYGARLGAATLVLYIAEGAVGLPFFRGGKRFLTDDSLTTWFPSSSFGYLLGFIIAAALVGYLLQKGWINSFARSIAAAFLGGAVLYVPGLVWLAIWFAVTKGMDANSATAASLQYGLIPFIPADILKAAVAGLGLAGLWQGINR